MMLTGYAPNASAVDAVGAIGRDLKLKASTKTGSFFWGTKHTLQWSLCATFTYSK